MLRIEKIQNLEIKGTIEKYQKEHKQICELLERISSFSKTQYKKQGIKKDVKVYHRISYNNRVFLILVLKQNAYHNPYYAILDMNNKEKILQYIIDIDILLPLLKDGQEQLLKAEIIANFSKEITLTQTDIEIMDYIKEYDIDNS